MPTERTFEEEELERSAAWVIDLERNVRRLLDSGPFIIGDNLDEVYGQTLGYAREKHLREALRKLHSAGVTSSHPRGPLRGKHVLPE
jgi:hypothetical protein